MKKIIHHLRKQPEGIRRHVLYALTTIAGIVLVILWTYSLGTSLASQKTQLKIKQDLKPFTILKDNLLPSW